LCREPLWHLPLTPEPDDDDDDDDDIDLRPEGASETDCLRSPEGYRDVLS
jgi:hypothetical protein